MIRFTGREKHKEMKSMLLKRPYLQNMQRKLIHPNFLYKIRSPGNESPEEEFLEKLPPEEEQVLENNEISINYVSTG